MGITLNKGTKEFIIVDVVDRLTNLTDLNPTTPVFDIRPEFDDPVLINQPATASGMRLSCLVDTSTLAAGKYELFVKFVSAPETPKLGPIDFSIEE